MRPEQPPEELKPERIQDRGLGDEMAGFAANLSGVLQWIEGAARGLRSFLGLGGDRKS